MISSLGQGVSGCERMQGGRGEELGKSELERNAFWVGGEIPNVSHLQNSCTHIRGSINNFVNFLYQMSNAKRLS